MAPHRKSPVGAMVLLAALGGIALTAGGSTAATTALSGSCSTQGLHPSYTQGSATYSVKVTKLSAQGVPCVTARTIARTVAGDILHGKAVPAVLAGLKVKLTRPCAGCTPNTAVSATGPSKRVTFVVLGGV